MKKKSQIVALVLSFMFFIIVFGLFLAGLVRDTSEAATSTGYVSGVEEFLLANLVLFIIIGMILGALYLANVR